MIRESTETLGSLWVKFALGLALGFVLQLILFAYYTGSQNEKVQNLKERVEWIEQHCAVK